MRGTETMKKIQQFALGLFLMTSGCVISPQNKVKLPNPPTSTGTIEFSSSDLVTFRDTMICKNHVGASENEPRIMIVSSPKALSAAFRIFANLYFIGMTRKQVFQILGDPMTISDYKPPVPTEHEVIYRIDTGLLACMAHMLFQNGKVVRVYVEKAK